MAELPNKISQIQVQAFGKESGELTHPGHLKLKWTSTLKMAHIDI